jgi:hypothetical protein
VIPVVIPVVIRGVIRAVTTKVIMVTLKAKDRIILPEYVPIS